MNREIFKEDGTADLKPWADELSQDWHCVLMTLKTMLDYNEDPTARKFAYMRKEARRMASDIERMAQHAGFSRTDLDNVGPL